MKVSRAAGVLLPSMGGPRRQHVTAGRRTWTNRQNRLVIECFYLSKPEKTGYRKEMYAVWIEKGGFLVAEQRLGQKRLIFQRKWLSNLEIEEIRRSSKNKFDFSVFEDNYGEEQWFLAFDKDVNGVYEPKDMIIDIENGGNHQRLDGEVEPQEEKMLSSLRKE